MYPNFPKTIRKKITYITVMFTMSITVLVASISYYMFNSLLSDSLVQSTEFNLHLISETIASDMTSINALSSWCSTSNSLLSSYLESSTRLKEQEDKYLLALNDSRTSEQEIEQLRLALDSARAENKSLAFSAWDRLQEEYRNTRSSVYVNRIVISNESKKYIQLSSITSNYSLSIYDTITQLPYFNVMRGSYPSGNWIGIEPNSLSDVRGEMMLPIILPVYSLYGTNEVGWCFLSVSTHLITDALRNYDIPESSTLFLKIGSKTYQVRGGILSEYQPDFETISQRKSGEHTVISEVRDQAGKRFTVVSVSSSLDGWSFSQTLSPTQFANQRTLYILIIIIVSLIVLALGSGLTYYLNHLINKPLGRIHKKIRLIAQGDFNADPGIEWPNELGEVGYGINALARDIVQLMNNRIEDEKEKKDLEYQMLQSQINPHFLYNTLNSIRWMAMIQNAGGIAEMTTSLARLLKSVSKNPHQMHTIRDEITLLDDYFLIQKYRYGGAISLSYNIESEDLYDCRILKFTMQPMVENAIFHGIEPKGSVGRIDISVRRFERDKIVIEIRDDGIGMSEEQIRMVLSGESETRFDFFRKIGINNVLQRIQYAFGPGYGLRIESEPGEYTLMIITLPYIIEKEGDLSYDSASDS